MINGVVDTELWDPLGGGAADAIDRRGMPILVDEKERLAVFRVMDSSTLIKIAKMPRHFYGVEFLKVHIRGAVHENSIFVVNGKKYRLYTSQISVVDGVPVLSKCMVFEDVFVNEVTVYDMKVLSGLAEPSGKLMCKIKTLGEYDFEEYPMFKDYRSTHEFIGLIEGVDCFVFNNNILEWNDSMFQVERLENINEENQYLKMWGKRVERIKESNIDIKKEYVPDKSKKI